MVFSHILADIIIELQTQENIGSFYKTNTTAKFKHLKFVDLINMAVIHHNCAFLLQSAPNTVLCVTMRQNAMNVHKATS